MAQVVSVKVSERVLQKNLVAHLNSAAEYAAKLGKKNMAIKLSTTSQKEQDLLTAMFN